jgi:hypothetical protein
LAFGILAFGFPLIGCSEAPYVNPWVDDSIPEQTWSTPSGNSVMLARAEPVMRHRNFPPSTAPSVDESTPHFPLWFQDPIEDQGDRDGYFAWTWQDYAAMPASYGRFIINTLGSPVSAVVDNPFKHMVSDGRLEQHDLSISEQDAKHGYSPDPQADKADFGYTDEDEPLQRILTTRDAP